MDVTAESSACCRFDFVSVNWAMLIAKPPASTRTEIAAPVATAKLPLRSLQNHFTHSTDDFLDMT